MRKDQILQIAFSNIGHLRKKWPSGYRENVIWIFELPKNAVGIVTLRFHRKESKKSKMY